MSIKANIDARRAEEAKRRNTKDAVLLILEAAEGLLSEVDVKMFWTGLAVASLDRAGIPKEEPAPVVVQPFRPMTDDEARAFGHRMINYGKHSGAKFDQIPVDYLAWLDETQFPCAVELHRYLESDYVQRESSD